MSTTGTIILIVILGALLIKSIFVFFWHKATRNTVKTHCDLINLKIDKYSLEKKEFSDFMKELSDIHRCIQQTLHEAHTANALQRQEMKSAHKEIMERLNHISRK